MKLNTYNFDTRSLFYLIPIVLLAQVITIVTVIVPYKLVQIGPFIYPGAAFLIPFFYILADIISEVFGYKTMRYIMWMLILATLSFCLLIQFVLVLSASPADGYQHLYVTFFSPMWQIISIGIGGWFIGPLINSFIISKWKIILHGRYFWLRSIGSSIFGQVSQVLFCTILAFRDYVNADSLIKIILFAIAYKLMFAIVVSFPATLLTNYLKFKTNIDVYDMNTNYNPLKVYFN